MARNDAQLKLYVPHDLRDRIMAYAKGEGRSTNAEIIRILEREFPAPESPEYLARNMLKMIDMLKDNPSEASIEAAASEMYQLMQKIVAGQVVGVDQQGRLAIKRAWEELQEEHQQRQFDSLDWDENEEESIRWGGTTAKVVVVDDEIPEDDK